MAKHTKIAAFGLGLFLGLGAITTPAYADTAALEQARTQLETLGQQLSALETSLSGAADDLELIKSDIETTQTDIDAASEKLESDKATLAKRTRANYKSGTTGLLELLLGATSFDDLVTRVYYMDKIADYQADAISAVRESKSALESKQLELMRQEYEQQTKLDDLTAQINDYQARVTEAQAVYNQLDEQDKAQLAAEAEAAANSETDSTSETPTAAATQASYLQTAVSASQAANEGQVVSAAVATNTQTTTSSSNSGSTQTTQPSTVTTPSTTTTQTKPAETVTENKTETPAASENKTETKEEEKVETVTKPSTSYDYSSGDPVSIAMQFVGKVPYVSGGNDPATGLDCSGLVKYVYGKCGVTTPRTTGTIEAWLKSRGTWTTNMDELSAGDIVFTSAGHVGIYAGNGYIIDAPVPGRMVAYRKVWSFYGGGSPW